MCVCVCFVDCNTRVAPISVTQSLLFFYPPRAELSGQRGSKRTEKRRKEKQGGMTERKEKGTWGRREVEESEKRESERKKKKDRWRRKWYVTVRWWRSKTTCRQTQTQRRKLRLSCRLFVRRTDGNTERKLHPEKINWLWKISTWSL